MNDEQVLERTLSRERLERIAGVSGAAELHTEMARRGAVPGGCGIRGRATPAARNASRRALEPGRNPRTLSRIADAFGVQVRELNVPSPFGERGWDALTGSECFELECVADRCGRTGLAEAAFAAGIRTRKTERDVASRNETR